MKTTYAGAGSRFLAFLVDVIILSVVGGLLGVVFGLGMKTSNPGPSALLNVAIQVLYFVVYQGQSGQTLGKRALGIRVVTLEGTKPSYGTFFLREIIGKLVSGIILFIGYLMILWDGKKQGLHDKIASTVVVKA
jgi:uncharacterized RDD family membrane protein YckC